MTKHHARTQASVALFGGSFDPIHSGHLAVARSAVKRFGLDRVYFIPSGVPPHKPRRHLAPFAHRMAMVSLACTDHPEFVASLAEAGEDQSGRQIFYSVDTVRHFRHVLHAHEHLYFILGADQFLGIATWKEYETLLELCDFIVANRPGFRMDALRLVIPPELLGRRRAQPAHADSDTILLRRTAIHPLATVSSHVSSTEIRRRIRHGERISGLVPPRVEEYIDKQALYR